MRIAFACSILTIAAGCGGAPAPVHGPYTGTTQRFYVTGLMLPQQRSDYAADLDGDGHVENGLGGIDGLIVSQFADNQHIDEIVAADPAPMILELTTDDATLRQDDSVGVRWLGGDGTADQIGARLHDGAVTSNPITATPAHATVRLPLYAAADPSRLALNHYQIELAPDGAGGFVGQLNGAIVGADAVAEMGPQLVQMIRDTKQPSFIRWFDMNRDGTITLAEVAADPFVKTVSTPDVQVGVPKSSAKDAVSVGFVFTLAPCSDDACTRPTPQPSCFDRVRNGDESDVDCGGSCGPCAGGSACTQASDCDARACDSGVCRAPSCTDAIADGFEIDVDCGDGCAPCVEGSHCTDDVDCQTNHCGNDGHGHSVCLPQR
jgi:hypothetical protein